MQVIASVATSADGYLDDCSPQRLVLSTPEDWAGVHALRATCDAILIGAETVRRDDPSLKGVPLKVVLTRSGRIPADARIFGNGEVLFLQGSIEEVVATLKERGVRRLMVEGGADVLRQFFDAERVDELRLFVNENIVVADERAPWFDRDRAWLQLAIRESRKCTPSDSSYCVGAVVVTADNQAFNGYTHETSPTHHAEQEAIEKALAAGVELGGATMYSSMEPCSVRKSEPESCSALIVRHGFRRVVFALREPDRFVRCTGAADMWRAGIEVVQNDSLAGEVRRINGHLL